MFNVFYFKKMAALIMGSLLTVVFFFVGVQFYGLIWGMVLMIVGMILGLLVGNLLLKNPFSDMLEGKGILTLDLNSTGIIKAFIVGVIPPYIKGKFKGGMVDDVFDRDAVMQLQVPKKVASKFSHTDEGNVQIEFSEDMYNKARFQFYQYPVLIWNSQIKTILTKDFLANEEKTAFAEHGVLYLNRKMEELTSHVRDFGRHIVELTRPAGKGMMGKWWVWLIIGFLIVVLVMMFAPKIMEILGGAAGTATKAVATAKNTGGGVIG